MNRKVIDISSYQPNVNYQAVKDGGVEGVILRCGVTTWGDLVQRKDDSFEKHYQGFKAVGMPVGVYYFSAAPDLATAEKEARFTIDLLKGKQLEYPVYFDVENPENQGNLSKRLLTDIVKRYLAMLTDAGYYAGVYLSKYWATSKVLMQEISNTVWIAQYAEVSTYTGRKEMWQYTSTGRVAGISQNVDLNQCYADFPAIIIPAGLNGFPKKDTTPGWKQDSTGWWYVNPNDTYPKDAWQQIEGKWYYFDSRGYMKTGWVQVEGIWYYLLPNGAMATGWQEIAGKHYYLDEKTGALHIGWVQVKDQWYYTDSSGVMQTGLLEVGGKFYYLQEDGVLAENETITFRADASGVLSEGGK